MITTMEMDNNIDELEQKINFELDNFIKHLYRVGKQLSIDEPFLTFIGHYPIQLIIKCLKQNYYIKSIYFNIELTEASSHILNEALSKLLLEISALVTVTSIDICKLNFWSTENLEMLALKLTSFNKLTNLWLGDIYGKTDFQAMTKVVSVLPKIPKLEWVCIRGSGPEQKEIDDIFGPLAQFKKPIKLGICELYCPDNDEVTLCLFKHLTKIKALNGLSINISNFIYHEVESSPEEKTKQETNKMIWQLFSALQLQELEMRITLYKEAQTFFWQALTNMSQLTNLSIVNNDDEVHNPNYSNIDLSHHVVLKRLNTFKIKLFNLNEAILNGLIQNLSHCHRLNTLGFFWMDGFKNLESKRINELLTVISALPNLNTFYCENSDLITVEEETFNQMLGHLKNGRITLLIIFTQDETDLDTELDDQRMNAIQEIETYNVAASRERERLSTLYGLYALLETQDSKLSRDLVGSVLRFLPQKLKKEERDELGNKRLAKIKYRNEQENKRKRV